MLNISTEIVGSEAKVDSRRARKVSLKQYVLEKPRRTCRLEVHMGRNYQPETSTAEGGFPGRIHTTQCTLVEGSAPPFWSRL